MFFLRPTKGGTEVTGNGNIVNSSGKKLKQYWKGVVFLMKR